MNRQKWIIVCDAIPAVMIGLIAAIVLFKFFGVGGLFLPLLFVILTLYFFRNPERQAAAQPLDVLSPADGVVQFIGEVYEDRYLKRQAVKVSIFLSVVNVHVNRSPIAGIIEFQHYQPGKFLPAFKGHASAVNERNYLGIRSKDEPSLSLLVVQITGFIARRIVSWVKEGDQLEQGQRFGMIKFGSCTEVYLPLGSALTVQVGQNVRGGETIIGRLRNE